MAFQVGKNKQTNLESHGLQRLEQESRSGETTRIYYIRAVSLKLKWARVQKCCVGASFIAFRHL